MDAGSLRNTVSSAIRFWEPLRLVYNAALAVIVLTYFVLGLPASKKAVSVDGVLVLFLLAVIANVAYCSAYVVDVFAQASMYREIWRKARWILFVIGLTFSAILTRFISAGMFQSAPN